jgi:protein-tyrosine phosphatase
MRTVLYGLIPLLAAAAAGWLIALDRQGRLVWDHWDEAKRGILYRSGQLTAAQLKEATRRYDIRTVVNLQMPGEELDAERALTKALGVDFVNLPMPGDGFGEEWQFREILKIIDIPERRPVLVHCARGTCRTGAAVAMYRFERDGWTIDDVAVEMRRQTYRYGWLPGYIYAMAKNKPASALPQPEMLYEHNRPEGQARGMKDKPGRTEPVARLVPPRSAMIEAMNPEALDER